MSKQSQARRIGIFTVLAIVILVMGVIAFGSGTLFKEEYHVEMVFPGDVSGLSVGSSLSFRGVNIGHVEAIAIEGEIQREDLGVRVLAKVLKQKEDEDLFESVSYEQVLDQMVEQGLAAKLVTQSVLTGRLQVKLEFYDGEKHIAKSQYGYPVIPTVPQDIELLEDFFEDISDQLAGFDIEQFSSDLQATMEGIKNLTNNQDFNKTMENAASITGHIDSILADANGGKYSLTEEAQKTMASVRELADSIKDITDSAKPVVANTSESVEKLNQALAQFTGTLKTYQTMVEPGSELSVSLIQTMNAIERSANQLRQLAETLQRNPESILSGKQN